MQPRPATPNQLYTLNSIRCLKLVDAGKGDPIEYTSAWSRLEEAQRAGLWTPKRPRSKSE